MRHERLSPLPPVGLADGTHASRRLPSRVPISIFCEFRQGTDGWQRVRLTDLSQSGFRIAFAPRFRVSEPLRIRIAGLSPLTAHIRWSAGGQMGCEFEQPLHVAVFEHIVRQSQGY